MSHVCVLQPSSLPKCWKQEEFNGMVFEMNYAVRHGLYCGVCRTILCIKKDLDLGVFNWGHEFIGMCFLEGQRQCSDLYKPQGSPRNGRVWRGLPSSLSLLNNTACKYTMVKLTTDLINESVSHINPLNDRELVLRGTTATVIWGNTTFLMLTKLRQTWRYLP